MTHNSSWRVDHPESLQLVSWESWPEKNQSCQIVREAVDGCAQGRIPLYSAAVESTKQVQQAVSFAKHRNLRLVVRNTGHDMAGRSSAPGSLQILTSGLKGINYTENFVPFITQGSAEPMGPAVTIGAGILTGELYATGSEKGFVVLGGACSTVGIAGGFIQSGGMGILSPSKGLGSDHVLQVEIVTADGSHIIANQYQNEDLFWAVRGGGGGTFGVITSVTLRAFADLPATVTGIQINTPSADAIFWAGVKTVLSILPELTDAGNSARMIVLPASSTGGASASFEGYTFNKKGAVSLLALQRALDDFGIPFKLSHDFQGNLSRFLAAPKGVDLAGISVIPGSVFLSYDLVASKDGPAKVTSALSDLRLGPGSSFSVDAFGGGQVVNNKNRINSAVHPDWRSALLSLTVGRGVPPGYTLETLKSIESELENDQLPRLRSLEGGRKGAYLAVAYPNEVYFQDSFWGKNYDRLLKVKRAWDPEDLFITRVGVGSERWDDEGMCTRADSGLWHALARF